MTTPAASGIVTLTRGNVLVKADASTTKCTVLAASGNTDIVGTLDVAGDTTLAALGVGAITGTSTLTVAGAVSGVTTLAASGIGSRTGWQSVVMADAGVTRITVLAGTVNIDGQIAHDM